jgi:hypothetical protein
MKKLEPDVDHLFGLPLEEFTAARNELARRLKNEGNQTAAAEVQKLSKPSIALWTINQLARQQKVQVEALLDAAATIRKTQEKALESGGGSAEKLRLAQTEERRAIRELTQNARELLVRAGRPPTATVLERISSTLRAAAVDEPGRTDLKQGRLSGEVETSGFDAFARIKLPETPQRGAADRDELAARRQRNEQSRRIRRELQDRAARLAAEAKDEERKAERAEKAAGDARKRAQEKRRQAEQAADELKELEEETPSGNAPRRRAP